MNVYLRTKHDFVIGLDIPHNHNFASAMYGFRELGYEIIPYENISEIINDVTIDDIVIDYVKPSNDILKKFNVFPDFLDYPIEMKKFLGRKIKIDSLENFIKNKDYEKGYFIKPVINKFFNGKIINSFEDLRNIKNKSLDIYVSEPLNIIAEWRVFILYDEILDIRPYGLLSKGKDYNSWKYNYDISTISEMLEVFKTIDKRPNSIGMDIGLTDKFETILIEFNDAYSIGSYGLSDKYYAKFLSARWSQLLNREDYLK